MRGGVGAGGRKEKPHNPLMISVQKVRIRPGKGKGQSDGWFPQPLTHNTRRVCTDDPENKLPMHSLCPTREWEREWYGVTTPNIVSGQGVILFPFGATPPLIGEAEEVVAAEPLGAFNRDPNDLVLTVGGKLVVNHLLEHDFLSDVQLQSLLDDLDRVPLSEKAPIFNENPPIVGRPQDSGTRRTLYGNYGGANHHRHNPHKLHDLPVLKRVADRVLETAKKTVVGGVGWSCTILDMADGMQRSRAWCGTPPILGVVNIPLSTEGTLLSGSGLRGTIRAARVASKRAARAARAERKQHTHHAQNAQNAQHGVLEADLEADFRHAQNA